MNPVTGLACVAAAFLSASLFSHTVALRLMLLLVGVALALVAIVRRRDELRLLPPIWLPFLLWAAWAALSLLWSVEPERTAKELRNEVVYTALALWLCFLGAQAPKAARIFLTLVGAAAAAAVAVALYEYSRGWERYLEGLHGGPGDHSSALLTLMPCVAMAAWHARRTGWPLWILGLSLVVSAYFTLNRTVWLGFAIELLVLGSLLALRHRASAGARWRVRTKLLAAAVAFGVVASAVAAVAVIQAERGAKPIGRDNRLALWPEIIEQIGERPVTGHGFGRGLLRGELRAELGALDGNLWHAHNFFLEAWLQVGFVGLALHVALLATLVLVAWRAVRSADDARATAATALIAVVAGMLVRNMTDTLLVRQNALLFWGVSGVLLALSLAGPGRVLGHPAPQPGAHRGGA